MNKRILSVCMPALLSAAGAFGTAYAFFSYGPLHADLSLWVLFLLFTVFLSAILGILPSAARHGSVVILLLGGIFTFLYWPEGFTNSVSLAVNVLSEGLSEPYDLVIPPLPVSDPAIGTVPAVRLFFWMASLFFAASPYSTAGRLTGGLLSVSLTFFGLYFGAAPSLYGMIFALAYWIALTVSASARMAAFVCMLAASFLMMAVIPAHSYHQPSWASDLSARIEQFSNQWFGGFFEGGSAFSSVLKGADGRGRLGQTNGIRYTGRPILQFSSPTVQHRLYLRSWSGSVYADSQWHDLPDDAYSPVSSLFEKTKGEWYDQGAWLMEILAQDPSLQSGLASASDRSLDMDARRQDFSVNAVLIDTRYYFIPYDASFSAPVFAFDRSPRGSYAKQYETYRWQIPEKRLEYLAEGPSYGNPYLQTYQQAEKAYRRFVYAHYLSVPAPVLRAVRQAVSVPSVHTEAEKRAWIAYVQQFFRQHFQYTETPGRVPSGYDFIDWFLNYHREGYCTYFASAGTMMLRAAGIPARYVVGQTAGPDEINNAPVSEQGLHTLTLDDRHSHAWTEVYVDGVGWRPVEMTPGLEGSESPYPSGSDGEKPSSPQDNKAPSETDRNQPAPPPAASSSAVSPAPLQAPAMEENRSAEESPSLMPARRIWPAVLPAAALCAAFWSCLRIRNRRRLLCRIPDDRSFRSFGQPLFLYALKLIRYAGLPAPGRSYESWTSQIMKDPRFSGPGFSRFMSVMMQNRFGDRPVTPDEAKEVLLILRRIRQRMTADMPAYKKWIFTLWKGL